MLKIADSYASTQRLIIHEDSTRLSGARVPIRMLVLLGLFFFLGFPTGWTGEEQGIRIGVYTQEVGHLFGKEHGTPPAEADYVALSAEGKVYACSAKGVSVHEKGKWHPVSGVATGPSVFLSEGNLVLLLVGTDVYRLEGTQGTKIGSLPKEESDTETIPFEKEDCSRGLLFLSGDNLASWSERKFVVFDTLPQGSGKVFQVAESSSGETAVAAENGLFVKQKGGSWTSIQPEDELHGKWIPYDVKGVAFDREGRLWFAYPGGVGCRDGQGWILYAGRDGLPYNDFTCVVPGEKGVIWFGTRIGAIRYDGKDWEYRQGKRWLPGDEVRDIVVDGKGNAWLATDRGVGFIERVPMRLADKAKFFEDEIDLRHRRTPYGYVLEVTLKRPGDKSEWINHDSDNDGLWTSMYGAGECFAYAATHDPKAKQRAHKAFEALRFLSQVTQGGTHPAPKGFPARSILPTTGPDPNDPSGGPQRDRWTKEHRDAMWKILYPRWPVSEDGKWYWKTDTSSDELDGHYFFYATYYDLAAESEEERAAVRDVVMALTDHLIDHGFNLVDWDGKPTRWAHFGPEDLNFKQVWWEERGLNSLSILSYLKVAEHVSGGAERYRQAYRELIEKHSYAQNVLVPKIHSGPGTGNQSDDEMAFMNYYNLLKYETDPDLKSRYAFSLYHYWKLIEPEMNPFFNYIAKASLEGIDYGDPSQHSYLPHPGTECLEDSLDTLKRYPINLIRWSMKNSHRIDILPVPSHLGVPTKPLRKGYRPNGKVLPIDERFVQHWNPDPWELDYGGNGMELSDGAAFLLPYYMGLYHGFIIEEK